MATVAPVRLVEGSLLNQITKYHETGRPRIWENFASRITAGEIQFHQRLQQYDLV